VREIDERLDLLAIAARGTRSVERVRGLTIDLREAALSSPSTLGSPLPSNTMLALATGTGRWMVAPA
jgi:hypothetical protein